LDLNCIRCKTEVKNWHRLEKFYLCKSCKHIKAKERCKEYYKKNRENLVEYRRRYVGEKREEVNAAQRDQYQIHKEKRLLAKKEYIGKPEVKKQRAEYARKYYNKRIKTDIQFKLSKSLRNRLKEAVKDGAKSGSAVSDLGCSIDEFKLYIENLFKDGMSWNNWGKWHLDHIIPLSSVDLTVRENVLKVCHYTNIQPLWAEDNIRKGCKV
jgi:hypothetical protein